MNIPPRTLAETARLFGGGVGAGLVIFTLFGALWQVTHFWWVMAAVSLICGLLAIVLRQNIRSMLSAVLDNVPGI